jgi:hypothetical protein
LTKSLTVKIDPAPNPPPALVPLPIAERLHCVYSTVDEEQTRFVETRNYWSLSFVRMPVVCGRALAAPAMYRWPNAAYHLRIAQMTENKSAPAAFVHKTTPLNNSHTHLIVPGVYLGGEVSARSKELLLNLNVGGIVNCTEGRLSDSLLAVRSPRLCAEIDNHFEISRTFEYLQLDLSDEVRTRISEVWQGAFAFIEEQHAQNKVCPRLSVRVRCLCVCACALVRL